MKPWVVGAVLACTAWNTFANEWAVLATQLNGQEGPALMVLRRESGEVLLKAEDLATLRLRLDRPPVVEEEGQSWVPLSRIPGLSLELDPVQQRLLITADPRLLPRSVLGGLHRDQSAELLGETSGYLNWAVEHFKSGASHGNLRLSGEAGLRLGPMLLQNTVISRDDPAGRRLVRLNTWATRDWPGQRTRLVVGDYLLRAPELGGSANLGGLSYSRVFALDPYAPRRTAPDLRGQLAYPSEVEVLVDGRRVRREQLPAGEFEIRDLYLQEGTRNLQVVTRDPYGRIQTVDYSFYASDSLLRQGTSEFDYALGAMRRGYGQRNADYGPLALSAFHRFGLTPQLTMGAMAQGRDGLLQAGLMGTMAAGSAHGLLSWSAGTSRTDSGTGYAASLRYSLQRRDWGMALSWRKEGQGYAILSDPPVVSSGRETAGLYGNVRLGNLGGLSLGHTRQTVQQAANASVTGASPAPSRESTSIGWSRSLGAPGSWLRLDLARERDGQTVRHRIGVLLFMDLDREHRLMVTGHQDSGLGSASAQLARSLLNDEGWGWDVGLQGNASASARTHLMNASADLLARHVQLRASWQAGGSSSSANSLRLAASGGIAFVDGGVHFTRPVGDAYALARVGGLADVPVLLNGVSVGRTNARGELLVPRLSAYYENQLGVDGSQIPIDYAIRQMSRRIVLPARTGAVVDFGATRIRALQGRLVWATNGEPVNGALLRVNVNGAEILSATGGTGDVYLEQLAPGRHAGIADSAGGRCRFEVEMPANDDAVVEAGEIRCL